MYHGVKKLKVRGGSDANDMLEKKLLKNFFEHGTLTTTEAKAKLLKTMVDKYIDLAKRGTQASDNKMTSILPFKTTLTDVKERILPQLTGKTGGYVKVVKHLQRLNDGAYTATVEWAQPVTRTLVKEEQEPEKKTTKKVTKAEKSE